MGNNIKTDLAACQPVLVYFMSWPKMITFIVRSAKLKRLQSKILKKQQSAVFEQTCLDNDLLFKYTVFTFMRNCIRVFVSSMSSIPIQIQLIYTVIWFQIIIPIQ